MIQTLGPAMLSVPITVCGLRLTLETGVPVSSSDQTAKSTLYLTPIVSGEIWTYDSSVWTRHVTSEVSLNLDTAVAGAAIASGSNYDVYAYWTGSAIALELAVWGGDTTIPSRARQDGVWVKDSDHSRRLVGCIRGSASGDTEDSLAKRFVWNLYNRLPRPMSVTESADSWTYTTDTWRAYNNSNTNRLQFLQGLNDTLVLAHAFGAGSNTTGTQAVSVGIGLDVTNANSARTFWGQMIPNTITQIEARFNGYAGVGFRFLQMLERSTATGTTTFYGDNTLPNNQQAGINGEVWA